MKDREEENKAVLQQIEALKEKKKQLKREGKEDELEQLSKERVALFAQEYEYTKLCREFESYERRLEKIEKDIKDNEDKIPQIEKILTEIEDEALLFAFISKALYKSGYGPRCEFLYNANENILITLSAQLGYSKGKNFIEFDAGNHAPQNVFDKAQKIASTFQITDIEDHCNIGITSYDTKAKLKIFDFLIHIDAKTKAPDKDNLFFDYNALIKLFGETLDDKNIQELLKVMPSQPKEELDKYCKVNVGIGIDELQAITHYNKNPQNLNFDNIGSNEYGQIGAPSKPKKEALDDHYNKNPQNLNFDNIGGNEYGQIGAPSKTNGNFCERFKCRKSKNRVQNYGMGK